MFSRRALSESRAERMAMSWPSETSTSPSPSFTVLMVTTRMTPLALTANYTETNNDVIVDANDEEEEYTPYSDRPETYIVPIVLLLILVIGLTGNGVLALTILRHANMRNVPNTYVLSLALGDLLARNVFLVSFVGKSGVRRVRPIPSRTFELSSILTPCLTI